jgi:HEPN domain-containing protein
MDVPVSSPRKNALSSGHAETRRYGLKAFLVRHAIAFRKTHDLRDLLRQCAQVDPVFSMLTNSLLLLNQFAIDTRYPGLALSNQDARDAVAAMKQVRKFVRARLGLKTR